jgi:hypothetical protein
VTGWNPAELDELNRAASLRLTAGPQPGPETELGMVTAGGQLYVRAYRGPSSRWFQAAQDAGTGTITAGTLARAVRLIPGPGPADTIDDAYQAKYGNDATLLASPGARAATLRIDPA